jgi:uncharacterized membrane protein SirB2
MAYFWIKMVHVATVAFNLLFFNLRLHWMLHYPERVRKRSVRLLSQSNDTLLLAAGIALAWMSGQSPFRNPWLTSKLLGLLAYILFGGIALHWNGPRRVRLLSGLLALLCLFHILAVALTRDPLPWLPHG